MWIFEVIFVDFRLTKNNFFNKIESFVGRNTSNHDCQIFYSISNCETMYHWIFLLEITVVKKTPIWIFAPPTAIYVHSPGLMMIQIVNFHFSIIIGGSATFILWSTERQIVAIEGEQYTFLKDQCIGSWAI
jgi:hypothetical protein